MAERSFPPLRWIVEGAADPARALALANSLRLPIPLASLLVQRGIDSELAARRFLRPALQELADPHTLAGMDQAVSRIEQAVRSGIRIMVHGDYDVDGQCGAAMLTRVLRAAGADVLPFLPHRLRDGYDLGPAGVKTANEAGVRLIITCDCGITAVNAVEQAKAAGIDLDNTPGGVAGDTVLELERLRRENRELRVEREILKKAAAWFARETEALSRKSTDS